MTLTIIQTNPFRFNKDETDPTLIFPDLALRAYSFNIQINQSFYVVRVSYNLWANSPQVSIFDSTGIAVVSNAPLLGRFTDIFPNYLFNIDIFSGHYLVWDLPSQNFVFMKDA